MGKQFDKKSMKKVIGALREEPREWSELKTELGIPERTLSRILEFLQDCGLAHKEDGRFGRWYWFEYLRTYETREDYGIALKHSEELFLGFDAILAEEVNLWLFLPHPIADVTGRNIVTEGNDLKPFVEEHLKTGYPTIRRKLIEFRKPLSELRNLRKYHVRYVFGTYIPSWVNTPKPIKQVEKRRLESFRELADSFLVLKLKVEMGQPLNGSCQLCPKVHVKRTHNRPPIE